MSIDENTPVEVDNDDLDAFSADFFGQKSVTEEPASSKEAEIENESKDDAPQEDTQIEEDDTLANEPEENDEPEVDEEEEAEEPEPEQKPKKSRFQERIDELTGKAREAERERDALIARLEKLEQNNQPTPPVVEQKEDTGPSPDDTLDDGTEKYPLGEFDPQYIRDLTRFTISQEREALKVQEVKEREQQERDTQRASLQNEWEAKLGPAKERYPDFQEKGSELIHSFDGIDQAYGEYLTTAIMSLEYGTDVLYYLANNPDEASKIVASGPAKATLALGRIEAKFAFADEEKTKARPKLSKAPAPPVHVNKGSAVAKAAVEPDTDDLDAFSSEFFKKKRRS